MAYLSIQFSHARGCLPDFFKKVNDHTGVLCKVNQTTGRLIWNMKTALSLGAIGVVAGLLTGLLGVGGDS
jgi:outer membrane protein assembly factor BamB